MQRDANLSTELPTQARAAEIQLSMEQAWIWFEPQASFGGDPAGKTRFIIHKFVVLKRNLSAAAVAGDSSAGRRRFRKIPRRGDRSARAAARAQRRGAVRVLAVR